MTCTSQSFASHFSIYGAYEYLSSLNASSLLLVFRYVRRWWARVPVEKRAHYKELFGGMKGIIFWALAALAIGFTVNYVVHLQENPFTGRLRFISLSADQIKTIAQWEESEVCILVTTPLLEESVCGMVFFVLS